MLCLEDHNSPFWTGFLKAKLVCYSKYDIWICFFNGINLGPKILVKCFAGKSKLKVESTAQSKSKQTWFPWWLMPIGTIQRFNTQSTVLTNNSVLVASVIYEEWRWQPQQNLLSSVLSPICLLLSLNAVLVVVVVVTVCRAPDHRFPLSAATLNTRKAVSE